MNTLTLNTTSTAYKNTSILFWAFLIFFFTHSPLQAATMKFDNGFESGNLSGFTCSGNCPSVATSPIAGGKYSGNFDLTRNMATSYRTEVEMGSTGQFDFNQEYWIGFNYRHEDWAKDTSPEIAPIQIHNRPSSWDTSCTFGSASYNPFNMVVQNDEARIEAYRNNVFWRGPVQKKQWLNIVFHFKFSTGNDGFIEAWKDGVKLGRVDGPNQPKVDKCGKPMRTPYFKMGIYKWEWRSKTTQSTRRQLFIDNLKIAQGTNAYSMVSSTPETTPIAPIVEDTTPPVISNVQAAVTETSTTITWDTNEASDSAVKYGTTTGYGLNAGNSLSVTSHSVTLKDLTAGSLFNYRVSSKDSSGNIGSSANLTFATDKAIDPGLVDEGLVAHWPMDPGTGSTLPDLSANGYTGTLVNGALLTTSGGVKFDGVNDYVNVGKFDVPGKAMTISAWVWMDDMSKCPMLDCRIISKSTGAEEQDHYFMVSPVKVGTASRLRFRLKTNGVTSTLIATSGNLSNKAWFHVAAVYDGATMRLYKDGVEVGSMAKSGSITTNSNVSVWLGGNPPDATSRPWKGQIDDVSLYSYALTKEEISTLTPAPTPAIPQDITPPVISNVQAAVTETTATITWDTNEASDSAVKYGTTTGYGLNAGNSLSATSHSVTLKDLTAGSLFNYQVSSKDSSGNIGSSANLTFTTNKAIDPGLVAYWPMDPGTGSTLPDLSANGYTGTLVNGALLTTSGGVKFDGVNDYVNVGKFDVSGKALTISAWAWADDLANCSSRDCRIISKATGPEDQDHYFMVSPVKVGTATRLRFRLKTNGVTSTLIATSGNLSNKAWFHVAAVYDGATMRLYKDGVEVGSMAKSGSITTNSNVSVWLGGNPPSATSRPWKGQIDDVSLYSYALTKGEIAEVAK